MRVQVPAAHVYPGHAVSGHSTALPCLPWHRGPPYCPPHCQNRPTVTLEPPPAGEGRAKLLVQRLTAGWILFTKGWGALEGGQVPQETWQ